MTVSTNPVPELLRDELIDAAIRLTGIVPEDEEPSQKAIRLAATHLNLELASLQAEGAITTTVQRSTLSFVAGTYEYTLASDTVDIELGHGAVIGTVRDTSGTTETQVTVMSREDYLQLAVKTSVTGRPSRCYVERESNLVKLVFWPVPDATMSTFQYTRVRFLKAGDNGTVTMDLIRTWAKFLTYAVAVPVAMNSSLFERAGFIGGIAEKERARCLAGDAQHGPIQLRVGHNARNW